MSISRRAILSTVGLTLLTPLAGVAGPASASPSASASAKARLTSLTGDLAAIPDPLAVTGTWSRTADGGQRVVTGSDRNAVALSEQRIGAVAGYTARITVDAGSPQAVGSLVVRATDDGSAGYAASLDPTWAGSASSTWRPAAISRRPPRSPPCPAPATCSKSRWTARS